MKDNYYLSSILPIIDDPPEEFLKDNSLIKQYLTNKRLTREFFDKIFKDSLDFTNIKFINDHTVIPKLEIRCDFWAPHKNISDFPEYFKILSVYGDFNVEGNYFTSMKGFPEYIGGNCKVANNFIRSFKYCPLTINGIFSGEPQNTPKTLLLTDSNYRKYIEKNKWRY